MNKNEIRSRFKDALWYSQDEAISCIVGGAGGIGSWLSFMLARAGVIPFVYDYDIVELHNMGGQLFNKSHIGQPKVEAVASMIKDFSDLDIMISTEKYDKNSMTSPYMFSAFDNMEARKVMFSKWVEDNIDNPNAIFIDGRLLMEQMQIFCVTIENSKRYADNHLFDDSEVAKENCTMKQTSHSAAMIASLMVGFFTNHLVNINANSIVRKVPMEYEYFIPLNMVT